MAVAAIGASSIAACVAGETIVACAFAGLAVANAVGRTFRVVVGLIVTVSDVTPCSAKKARAFGAIQCLVTRVTRAKIVLTTGTFTRTYKIRAVGEGDEEMRR
jgi:hypothetical protein